MLWISILALSASLCLLSRSLRILSTWINLATIAVFTAVEGPQDDKDKKSQVDAPAGLDPSHGPRSNVPPSLKLKGDSNNPGTVSPDDLKNDNGPQDTSGMNDGPNNAN